MTADEVRAKVAALADAMMRQDDDAIVAHFADDAVMIAPSGRFVGRDAIYAAGKAFNEDYTNIVIAIKQVIACDDRGVVEWSFAETRRADGYTHTMEDAIVFALRGGQIAYWREYFDPLQEREI
jgi:uncharacterized protein (TIGR02246 family)